MVLDPQRLDCHKAHTFDVPNFIHQRHCLNDFASNTMETPP